MNWGGNASTRPSVARTGELLGTMIDTVRVVRRKAYLPMLNR